MKSAEIRQKFFDFFMKRNHEKVASSPLIPAQDPTLLFTNAGMNQFKDLFLGKEKRSYTRAVSIQKCVRAGGKHNDLDNVGFTKRHLTFFEMMGNFSFGDYFKREAINFAWDFLTKEMKLPVQKLYATVYKTDDEAYDIWHDEIGIPAERIARLGEKENFWQMGDTGPCGPCTEIHLDRGAAYGCPDLKDCGPACDCDRFLEIWNLVFMQFDRQPDGTDKPLKQTGVDTGMGLERLCAIVQDKSSVFEIDLFAGIMKRIEALTGKSYAASDAQTKGAFNVLADHIRSSSLIIADGCAPSNEGRGYVLRKIIRRAALFAKKLKSADIFPELSKQLVSDMGGIYPELIQNKDTIFTILESEIKKFSANLDRGQLILEKYFEENKATKEISGSQAFKLYDTYGFPLELLNVIAKENGFSIDTESFEQLMSQQQEQSGKKTVDELAHVGLADEVTTEFTGYQELETPSKIIALIDQQNKLVASVAAGQQCWVITDKSPFFIVGGGQVPDNGWLIIDGKETPLLSVRYINNAIGAHIKAPVALKIGQAVTSRVNKELRVNAMKNHTATHLLQAALMQVYGKQIKQSGSLVHPDYLRFDFTFSQNLSPEDVIKIENIVNDKIRQDIPVSINYMTLKEALNKGALAFFGDKYNPETVRMVEVPHFSTELCGGTHVSRTGEIGTFKITEMSAPAAGQKRIVALTGPKAIDLYQETFNTVKTLSVEFKSKLNEVEAAVAKQKEQLKTAQHQLLAAKKQLRTAQLPTLLEQVTTVGSLPYGVFTIENATADELKDLVATLQQKKQGLYLALSTDAGRAHFYASVAPEVKTQFTIKEFGTWLATTHNLKGGGAAHHIQGGGAQVPQNLKDSVKKWLETKQNQ